MLQNFYHFLTSNSKIILDIVTTILGLLYIYYNYHHRIAMWLVGFLMQLLGIILYFQSGLYADCGMEFYYLIMTIYGYYQWKSGSILTHSQKELPITSIPRTSLLAALFVISILWLAIWYILVSYTDSRVPIADSFTTALSIVGIWMLAKKYIEQWMVWLIVDVVTSILYYYKEIPFKATLYAFYVIIAIFGYRKWKKEMVNN